MVETSAMTVPMKIDFVSDVSCPWCAIGLHSLERALERLKREIATDLHFQPFELNPQMAREGQGVIEHLAGKYGSTPEQIERSGDMIVARGAAVGFAFDMHKRTRIYNTFDAHRLLHWADEVGGGKQRSLKHALFTAYFAEGRDPSDHEVLLDLVAKVGLDVERARQILDSDEYAKDVRARERFYSEHGIHAVPAIIINDKHLIQGGQPVEVFEQVLRQLATENNAAS
jgi:predicted DsbA family dithiol-disulfide isomerase